MNFIFCLFRTFFQFMTNLNQEQFTAINEVLVLFTLNLYKCTLFYIYILCLNVFLSGILDTFRHYIWDLNIKCYFYFFSDLYYTECLVQTTIFFLFDIFFQSIIVFRNFVLFLCFYNALQKDLTSLTNFVHQDFLFDAIDSIALHIKRDYFSFFHTLINDNFQDFVLLDIFLCDKDTLL